MIKVIVAGKWGSGKSTILEIIAKALTEHGIMNEPLNIQNEHPVYRPETLGQRIDSLKQHNTVVTIEEKQLPRCAGQNRQQTA